MNSTILNLILAIIPGTIWLLYFLQKDVRPEPNRQIIKIFLLGFIISIPAALFELFFLKALAITSLHDITFFLLKYILIVGLVEELFKYLVVKLWILGSSDIDEPIDIPLYMIISALGFATAENVLVFFTQSSPLLSDHLLLSFSRFIGATLLHALCSGIIGYFMTKAFCENRHKTLTIAWGFFIAIILHGLFDFFLESSIIKLTEDGWTSCVIYSIAIIVFLFVFLSIKLNKIRAMKGSCKI